MSTDQIASGAGVGMPLQAPQMLNETCQAAPPGADSRTDDWRVEA